jgi:hypothetical protein
VQITTLGIVVSDRNPAAVGNVRWNVLHAFRVESRLKLGRHESIAIAGIYQANKVDGEHCHVEGDRDDNKTEGPSEEMLEPQTLYHE